MNTPKPDRLIKLRGCDWSEFTVVGKWVLYKGQKNGRFMVQDEFGKWNAEIEMWKDGTSWEYLDEKKS